MPSTGDIWIEKQDRFDDEFKPKLKIEGSSDESCATFILDREDHTMGNALRYVLAKSPDVEFAGYSMPHPTESRVHVRVQTTGIPSTQALKSGLLLLKDMCGVMKDKYVDAVEKSMLEYGMDVSN